MQQYPLDKRSKDLKTEVLLLTKELSADRYRSKELLDLINWKPTDEDLKTRKRNSNFRFVVSIGKISPVASRANGYQVPFVGEFVVGIPWEEKEDMYQIRSKQFHQSTFLVLIEMIS